MKNLVGYIMAVVLFTACAKNKSNEVVVTGRLMQSCETPAANREGTILTADAILSGPGHIIDFTTDENGYFEARHSGSGFTRFNVRVEGASDVLKVDYLSGDKKELGEVYIFPPSASYYLYLDVDSAYTENDTLYYYDWEHSGNGENYWTKAITGPFSNGVIDTVSNISNINALPIHYDGTPKPSLKVTYYVNDYNSSIDKEIFTPHCKDEYQEVTLKIE